MVPATSRRSSTDTGLQPLCLARDWRQVLQLIEVAFGEDLDADARRSLRSMTPPPLLGSFIGLADGLAPPGEGVMPGFVWLEGGRVVGTTSVRRAQAANNGWLISNVAVHPDWQGRGIGRELMEAALDFAQDFGGAWVVLQVRDNNTIAQRLYESLGFSTVGEVTRFRKTGGGQLEATPSSAALRPARWSDGGGLSRLARTLTPHDVLWPDILNRELFRTGPLGRLSAHLKGSRRDWWVLDPAGAPSWPSSRPIAAVGVELDAQLPWHRLRVLVAPTEQNEVLASQLIAFGLIQLADAPSLPVEVEHPQSDETTLAALAAAGFVRRYSFIHMRADL